tara:strand:- start:768 stop:1037 length:270 start_codon:yes stop_codon:yes gene_type:complete
MNDKYIKLLVKKIDGGFLQLKKTEGGFLLLKEIDGGFCVEYIGNGKINENRNYFTICKKDALKTMELMDCNQILTNYLNNKELKINKRG